MTLTDLVVTVVVGAFVGWLAGYIMKTSRQMGLLADIVVGIVGSALGRWAFGILGLAAYGLPGALITAVGGAILLIVILKALKVFR